MNKRILIIDDEPDIIFTLRMALEQNGFKTDSYSDSILAYKNFRAGLYDLVLLDIKKIKRTDSRVKICFLTASEFYDEEIRKEQGFDGFDEELFLRKPVEIACLIDTIRPLMDLAFN
jgi:DNA-binding response OmpR family regulator